MLNRVSKYVITCGDEGVQLNEGQRIAFAGAGLKLPGFAQAVKILKKLLKADLHIAANQENAWVKEKFQLSRWEEVDATMQQQVEALADKQDLKYVGLLPFADPKELIDGVKGHMVRPKEIHIATGISFTLGGGEKTYNLGFYQISADWVSKAPLDLVKKVITPQVEFYQQLAGKKRQLKYDFQTKGVLDEDLAKANKVVLAKLGIK
ncbi:MAG: hypothetical protein GF390_02590 [Candidatus Pacebacteria bacterium]|nr:hypothetical protein [Candidatus Paceibacterota bacterium]